MRKVFLGLVFLFLYFSSVAQSFEIERLRKQIKEYPQQDSFRVNRLTDICNSSPYIQVSDMEKYASEALTLARRLNYSKGIGYALLVNARVASIKGQKGDVIKLLQQTDSVAKLIGDQPLQWWVMYRRTIILDDYKEKLSHLIKTESFAIQINQLHFVALSQIQISNNYFSLGDNARAMEYGMKALKNAEILKNPSYLYNANDILASVYSLIGEYDKANGYLQKQPALQKQLGYEATELSNLYNQLGENARLSKKYAEAIKYYKQAISGTTDIRVQTIPFSNLADVYTSIDSLSLAFQYIEKTKAGNKVLKRADLDSWIESILARAYLKQNKLDSALYYAKSGFNKANDFGVAEDILSTSKTLRDAYAIKGDYKNAYTYFNRYISLNDSVFGEEVKNKTMVLEYNLEMSKKEDQIALLNQQKKLQKNFLASALTVLGLILISAILLLRNVRQKQRANQLLQKQKQEIDEKAKELALQKESLEKSYNNVELLGQIGRMITASLSVEKIIGTVYDNVNALMDAAVFGIGIYHDEIKALDFPATYENGQALPPYSNSIYDQNRLAGLCFISGKEILINDLTTEYANYLQKIPTPQQGEQPSSLIYLPLKVKETIFGVITVQSFQKNSFSDYHLNMLRTIAVYAAIALENAESFKKLNETVTNLKETQKQLIQSEKMASLGELTAGIAHEIQNPLNFVNNFSEVNKELIGEMNEEIDKGNYEEVKTIAKNIEDNEEKINHHGKRADAIVKGMLQHSRNSNGHKELTDINALCDEYLRLSYHGLRAKDKSFNATMNTDFDASLEKVNIIPQDIGRVILNLLNNAFYAAPLPPDGGFSDPACRHEPTIWLKTSKNPPSGGRGAGVLISVSDNGPGISQNIIEKIFQPFFTTKPTGEGTGLGLSLSYDIVKAHGGTLKVDTVHGEGTTFTIALPLSL